jgi:uncharacterized protein YrzB (UPF0473 family)
METTTYVNKLNESKADNFLNSLSVKFRKEQAKSENVLKYTITRNTAKWHFIIEEVLERFHEQLTD